MPGELPSLHDLPDDVADAVARSADACGPIARQLSWHAEVSSTNSLALAAAERGVAEGWTVGAEAQTAGRGRHGRVWASPPGAGVYVSIVFRPPPHACGALTLAMGVAVADGIEAATGAPARLKWPNDVYLGASPSTGKVAGILAESGVSSGRVGFVVVGIGINVRRAALPPDVARRATSIEDELGRPADRGAVFVAVCGAVWSRYTQLLRGDVAGVVEAWRRRARGGLGRRVAWEGPDGLTRSGIARDVDAAGALVVETADGHATIVAGEVQWL